MIGIHIRKYSSKNKVYIQEVIDRVLEADHELLLFPQLWKNKHCFQLPEGRVHSFNEDLISDCEAVFCVGGDGSMLEVITYIGNRNIPILGINTGRLGFLSYVAKDKISEALETYFSGSYHLEERSLLGLEDRECNFQGFNFALNEFVLLRKDFSSMIGVSCWIDDLLVAKFWADGIMVATPTGSTGYSLSCGGPISMPNCAHFILTPINCHNLSARTLIVPNTSKITLEVERAARRVLVSLDSRSISMPSPFRFSIYKENFYIRLIQLRGSHFFNTLQEKMRWGFDLRNKLSAH